MLTVGPSTENREALFDRFTSRIEVNLDLERKLVSYQADKDARFYGWFKYREGFTSQLVQYLLGSIHPQAGVLLDPFSGSGAALFGAGDLGWETHGIELLPVGIHAMQARVAAEQVDPGQFAALAATLKSQAFTPYYDPAYQFNHIPITQGAFPQDTEQELVGYRAYCDKYIADEYMQRLAAYASFCILEEISYTRKDGQYLRWDARSGRSQGQRPFNKGPILSFKQALHMKLDQIVRDLHGTYSALPSGQLTFYFTGNGAPGKVTVPCVTQGSCLEILPTLPSQSVDVVLTSPPYCNRYDYTRTYALELVYLGESHRAVAALRQQMLSCTVENKTKEAQLRAMYEQIGEGVRFACVDQVFRDQAALQEVLHILDELRDKGALNNPHIARLVRNYFYEMCFVVAELARILKPGGHVIMVNDNVRYAGEEVPVDLILSAMAESFGLQVEKIWTLARGKGNSSQQMGLHGRSELRKGVCIWSGKSAAIDRA